MTIVSEFDCTATVDRVTRKPVERRRAARYPCGLGTSRHIMVKVRRDRGAANITAKVRNVSATGISLLVSRPLEPEKIVSIELCRPSRSWYSEIPIRVVYTVQHPDGEYIVGGAFDRALTCDELRGLMAQSRGACSILGSFGTGMPKTC